MAARRRSTSTKDNALPPGEVPPAVVEVIAMLARIEAATARVEEQLGGVLAELASLPRPGRHPAPRPPVARRPRRGRRPCRDYRPRLRGARQCANDRRDH
jgi:hypothetical protein